MTGKLFAIVGPSGVGKDTLMQAVQDRLENVVLVRRVITRPSDAGGEDFEGVSEAEFATRLARGDFVLHWQAHGLSYGIPASVSKDLNGGKIVLFNGSRAMMDKALAIFPALRVINITASANVLYGRLHARGRETEIEIARRLERARHPFPPEVSTINVDNSGALDRSICALIAAVTEDAAPA